jgi:hypothetical protein
MMAAKPLDAADKLWGKLEGFEATDSVNGGEADFRNL